ncbi:hypothetical protein F5J12DRAFT_906881 [Pisolithus orientalis]|uniref:uncharacterized protein n=1 Tax=Pisolithus orientalis TaxID=936130 RepID=UPI0022242CF7|nr:uncharacterized protein F5J12DRAFT_906881 [Pisolithus orientalis]KAI5998399.1 hypothetical protein F5J12DRAFT_906881 [Pisolithus orientalis]
MASTLLMTNLQDLTLILREKEHDVYHTSSEDLLLFITTGRILVFNGILKDGDPDKGKILTRISLFWFEKLKGVVPDHHTMANTDKMPKEKAKVIPIEFIVQGYLTGPAWVEYKRTGTMHRMPLPQGMVKSQQLHQPLVTSLMKAEQGTHDENAFLDRAGQLIGSKLYTCIAEIALKLYSTAAKYAYSCGLILTDSSEDEVVLVDKALTPDSLHYFLSINTFFEPLYIPGKPQPALTSQYERDWLVSVGCCKHMESGPGGNSKGWGVNEAIIQGMQGRYSEAEEMLKNESPKA